MSRLEDIQAAQKTLEDSFQKKLADLEAQLHVAGSSTSIAKLAEELRTFKELVFNMFGLLRTQIKECTLLVDGLETRHRRKALVFFGVAEEDGEDCKVAITEILHTKLALKDLSTASIKTCHRIGVSHKDQHRPILVKFDEHSTKSAVWSKKSGLIGSPYSVKEFLTRTRQAVFGKARTHFGIHNCWTQDGTIVVKVSDGSRHKIVSGEELDALVTSFPNAKSDDASSGSGGHKTSEEAPRTRRTNRK